MRQYGRAIAFKQHDNPSKERSLSKIVFQRSTISLLLSNSDVVEDTDMALMLITKTHKVQYDNRQLSRDEFKRPSSSRYLENQLTEPRERLRYCIQMRRDFSGEWT